MKENGFSGKINNSLGCVHIFDIVPVCQMLKIMNINEIKKRRVECTWQSGKKSRNLTSKPFDVKSMNTPLSVFRFSDWRPHHLPPTLSPTALGVKQEHHQAKKTGRADKSTPILSNSPKSLFQKLFTSFKSQFLKFTEICKDP